MSEFGPESARDREWTLYSARLHARFGNAGSAPRLAARFKPASWIPQSRENALNKVPLQPDRKASRAT